MGDGPEDRPDSHQLIDRLEAYLLGEEPSLTGEQVARPVLAGEREREGGRLEGEDPRGPHGVPHFSFESGETLSPFLQRAL